MHQRVRVRKNVFARHTTPKPAVVGIAAIVAHYEITVVPNFVRLAQIVRFGAAGSVLFRESLAIHPHRTVVDFNGISRQADNALDVIRRIRRKRRLENNDLLAMRIAPHRRESRAPARWCR